MKFFSFALLAGPAVSWAFVPTTLHHTRSFSSLNAEVDRRSFSGVAASAAAASVLGPVLPASAALSTQWTQVQIPFTDTLYDIDFDTKDHGYMVGARGTFAETNDGGLTWQLPGEPASIIALGPSKAEMTTSSGAVYYTENAGRNWKAQVKETIDATLNRISSSGVSGASYFTGSIVNQVRDKSGAYLAVSSRGNFFLTWSPGQDFWIPHNRGTPRRIQNMGFIQNDLKKGVWMTLNGGKLFISPPDTNLDKEETTDFTESDIKTGGYGITDVAFRSNGDIWAVGGSNTIYVSRDGGKKFSFDNSANKIPGNLYNVKFFEDNKTGFALGSNGVLMRFTGDEVVLPSKKKGFLG
ncbi:hypothetical protein TrRE_jg4408 [Triparma retinervis]|uniref:Photosynthesis system II assembly factor Ycf48/Hcf136-like domain-containing protein n=1 Tax=Triparma retinervis TaxID=2557542 RepID=A0A9W7CAB5_9STRA|nr:hypothetical protein TrRE_jg4408 [Triparma retinervis]